MSPRAGVGHFLVTWDFANHVMVNCKDSPNAHVNKHALRLQTIPISRRTPSEFNTAVAYISIQSGHIPWASTTEMWCKMTRPIPALQTTPWVKRRPSSIKRAKMHHSRGGRRWIVLEALQGKGLGLRRAWTKTHLQRNISAANTQTCEEFTHCNAATKASGEAKQSCQKFSTINVSFVQVIAPGEEWAPSSEMDSPNGQFGHVISSWHQPNALKSRHVHGDSIHN